MKKFKTKDLKEVLKYNGDIVVDEYNYYDLIVLYNYYLMYNEIKLTYNNIDLKEYAKSHKHGKGNPDKEEKWEPIVNREIDKIEKMVKRAYIFSVVLMLEATAGILNYSHHEDINIDNSKFILENFTKDTDGDGIKELQMNDIREYNNYIEPTDSILYSITNPMYFLSDKNKISSAYSMKKALKDCDIKYIEYNNNIYTSSGYMSFATYKSNGKSYLLNIPYSFDSQEQAEEIIAYFLERSVIDSYSNIDYIGTIDVKTFDELPTIYKSKNDNEVTTKEAIKLNLKLKK